MTGAIGLRIIPYAALGSLIGAGYFGALAWNVRLYVGHTYGRQALLVHLLRLAVAGAAFTLCARQGAAPMIASFMGFLAIRTITINRYGLAAEKIQ